MELYTYNTFRDLSKKISPPEYQQLEESILKHGCLTPIITWGDVIIDGHKRYAICKKYNIPFRIDQKHFRTLSDAKKWAIRHVNPFLQCNDILDSEEKCGQPSLDHSEPMLAMPLKPVVRQNSVLHANCVTSADIEKAVHFFGERFGVNFLKELVFISFNKIAQKQDKEATQLLFQQLYNLNFIPAFQKDDYGIPQF